MVDEVAAWPAPEVQVTVLLPVFNGEDHLAAALDSLLEQSFADFELVLVDDGSTDATPEIVASYAARDSRVAPLRQPENRGLVAALNAGLARARGSYIARQDADDISLPERLERQVRYLEKHPEVGLLGSAYYRTGETGRRRRTPPTSDVALRWRLLFGNVFCHSSVMFRRDLLPSDGPWYREFPHAEDYDLWTRLLRRTRVASLPNPLVLHREHAASILGRFAEESRRTAAKISLREVNHLPVEREIDGAELETLRRCHGGRPPAHEDLPALPRLLSLFEAYAAGSVEPRTARRLRAQWVRRRLALLPLGEWRFLARSGLLRKVAAGEPVALIAAMLLGPPQRAFSGLRGRWQVPAPPPT